MILKVLACRILSMLYIFQIYYDFANISFKKCWQIFRSYKICQHLLDFIVDSTIFDTLKSVSYTHLTLPTNREV